MIKNNQRSLNRTHVLLDALVIAFSYTSAWYLIIESGLFLEEGTGVLAPSVYFIPLLVIIPMYLLLYGIFQLYTPKRVMRRRVEFANICKANTIGLLIFTLVLYLGGKDPYFYNFSRRMVMAFFVLNILMEVMERLSLIHI